jgi:hypothetical protein
MNGRARSHERFRELLAARLDGPLTRAEHRLLSAHLRSCAECRQVAHDYRLQRFEMQALPAPIPPRDMWARTSVALDREIARGRYRPIRRNGRRFGERRVASTALVTALVAVGAATALTISELMPAVQPGTSSVPGTTAEPGKPTPFTVAAQQLAFIGTSGASATDLELFRTQVNRMCPDSAQDCIGSEGISHTQVSLPGGLRPRNAALSPSGRQLALVGQDVGTDVIAVVILPADQQGSGGPINSGAVPGSSGPGSAITPNVATESTQPAQSTGQAPITTAQVPGESVAAIETPPSSAVPGLIVLAILDNVHSTGAPPAWSADGSMLAFSAMPADDSAGPDVYVWQPGDSRAQPITSDHDSFFASWSGPRIVASRAMPPPEDGAPVQLATVVIDPRTLVERQVDGPQMWLPVVNAQRTKAVAWFGRLDFSSGLPVPTTGELYLVDWARIDPFGSGAGEATAPPTAPAATPTLAVASPTLPPEASLPPETSQPPDSTTTPDITAPPDATGVPDATKAPDASALPTAASSLAAAPMPSATADATASPEATVTPTPTDTAVPVATATPATTAGPSTAPEPSPSAVPAPTAAATPADSTRGLVAIEPTRDPVESPVTDWQVRWSSDGQVLGVWIADAPGSSWGQLVVTALNETTNQLDLASPLLPPTLARRGFTLGLNRVAWVGSSDLSPDGELRIRTWGVDGIGGLRLQPLDLTEVVPAF